MYEEIQGMVSRCLGGPGSDLFLFTSGYVSSLLLLQSRRRMLPVDLRSLREMIRGGRAIHCDTNIGLGQAEETAENAESKHRQVQ
jgi:hypothetical protein